MNIDMVGTGDADLLVGGLTEFAELYAIARKALDPATAARLKPRPNYRGSDHTSFWAKNVPAISLRTGEVLTEKLDDEHPEYHMPGDGPGMIDPELLREASQYHCDVIAHLATTRENLLDPVHRTLFLHRDASVVDMHCDTISRALAGEDLTKDLPEGPHRHPQARTRRGRPPGLRLLRPAARGRGREGPVRQRRLRPDPGRPRARRQEPG